MPFLGRRRGWILAMQLALAAAIALLRLQNPAAALTPFAVCALAIVFFSATQDIAIDAYRTDVTTASERGLAAAAANLGYRVLAWIASVVALVVGALLRLAAGVSDARRRDAVLCVATLRAPSSHNPYQPRSLAESVVEPLKELLGTPSALTLIVVVLLFKIGDAFANKLFTPFMMDVGFSKSEIGAHRQGAVHRERAQRLGAGRHPHGAPGTVALDARLRGAAGAE